MGSLHISLLLLLLYCQLFIYAFFKRMKKEKRKKTESRITFSHSFAYAVRRIRFWINICSAVRVLLERTRLPGAIRSSDTTQFTCASVCHFTFTSNCLLIPFLPFLLLLLSFSSTVEVPILLIFGWHANRPKGYGKKKNHTVNKRQRSHIEKIRALQSEYFLFFILLALFIPFFCFFCGRVSKVGEV